MSGWGLEGLSRLERARKRTLRVGLSHAPPSRPSNPPAVERGGISDWKWSAGRRESNPRIQLGGWRSTIGHVGARDRTGAGPAAQAVSGSRAAPAPVGGAGAAHVGSRGRRRSSRLGTRSTPGLPDSIVTGASGFPSTTMTHAGSRTSMSTTQGLPAHPARQRPSGRSTSTSPPRANNVRGDVEFASPGLPQPLDVCRPHSPPGSRAPGTRPGFEQLSRNWSRRKTPVAAVGS